MSIVAWIIMGLVAGFIASRIVDHRGRGFVLDVVLGVAGALAGGFLFHLVGATGVTGFNLWSVFVSMIGAVILLWIARAFAGRRSA
jgi:uncharacterized membrane protein YeaQ/YmgE (transglycosylase-associated protein family)